MPDSGCQVGVCKNDTCIAFKHSGGESNCDPCMDLGGSISTCDITKDDLENLFHSIGPNLTRLGHTDYRCFYVQNTSMTETLRNVIIYMDGVADRSGVTHAIGVNLQSAVQWVVVSGTNPPNEGEYFECLITTVNGPYTPQFKVYYDPNITKWTGNFQTAIRTVEGMPEVVVYCNYASNMIPNITFVVNFGGHSTRNSGVKGSNDHSRWDQAANHLINQISIMSNTLTGCTVTVMPIVMGSPVNTTAEMIANEPTPPKNQSPPLSVTFDYYYRGNPVRIGSLRPQEWCPIWIRRVVPAPSPTTSGALAGSSQTALLVENFTIRVEGTYP